MRVEQLASIVLCSAPETPMPGRGGDPMVFIPLKDAQEVQFLKDNESIVNDRHRLAANPAVNRPGQPGVLSAVEDIQTASHRVNAVLVRVQEGYDSRQVADNIKRWKHLTAYTSADMEDILVAKLIATAARQIALFLIILAVVSAAIVAFIIYTMTLGKIKEIAVLKLIGTRDRTIAEHRLPPVCQQQLPRAVRSLPPR